MSESAARAERLEFRTSPSPSFLWNPPERPLAVRLTLEVIERLERDALESFRSVSSRGSEVGGILLGSVEAGDRPLATVTDYLLIPCDYSRGPLYRLGDADKARFDAAIKEHAGNVVGFFRSNTRKGLSLDAEDISFIGERFSASDQFAMVVRPFATRPSIAGIFVWQDGAIDGEASALEFPFSAAEMIRQADPGAAAGASRPAARGQIVPIASRREPSVLEPPLRVEPPLPQPPPLPLPAEPKPVEPVLSNPRPSEPRALAAKAPEPEPVAETRETEPTPAPAPAPPPSASLEAPSFGQPEAIETASASPLGGRLKWLLAAAGAVVLGVLLFVYPGFLRPGPKSAGPAAASLGLRAERTASDLLVTWNRDADAIRNAHRAVLSISDGPQQENVSLDLAQLRNGSIVYTPATADVSFKLEVIGSGPAQSETLRVLKTRPSAMPPDVAAQPGQPAQPVVVLPPEPADEEEAPKPARKPSRPFDESAIASPASRLRAARPTDLPEPPPTADAPANLNLGGVPSAPVASPSPLPSAPQPAAPPPTAAAKPQSSAAPRVGGVVKPAELISRRDPIYPPLARQAKVQGTVTVEASIGADGKVMSVAAVQGHAMLRQAAVDAVKRWVYKPATLNGQAIESTSRVEVNFTALK